MTNIHRFPPFQPSLFRARGPKAPRDLLDRGRRHLRDRQSRVLGIPCLPDDLSLETSIIIPIPTEEGVEMAMMDGHVEKLLSRSRLGGKGAAATVISELTEKTSLSNLAAAFAAAIPEKFSPAEIQGFLLTRKQDPLRAARDLHVTALMAPCRFRLREPRHRDCPSSVTLWIEGGNSCVDCNYGRGGSPKI